MTQRTRRYMLRKTRGIVWQKYDCRNWVRTADGKHEIAIGTVGQDDDRPVWIREMKNEWTPDKQTDNDTE